jgi:hypothetical protein
VLHDQAHGRIELVADSPYGWGIAGNAATAGVSADADLTVAPDGFQFICAPEQHREKATRDPLPRRFSAQLKLEVVVEELSRACRRV